MITQRDMDKILTDVNRVFSNFQEQLNELKEKVEKLEKPSTTTSKVKSQEKA